MTHPVNSNSIQKNTHPLFSNPLKKENEPLILRIILLIGVILVHILTLGLLLIYYYAKKKTLINHKITVFQKTSINKTVTKSSSAFIDNTLEKKTTNENTKSYEITNEINYFSDAKQIKTPNFLKIIEDFLKENAPKHTLKFNPDGSNNLYFKFSFPKTVLNFFKENHPEIFENPINKNSFEKIQKQNILKQINYLDQHYYIINIQGDGLCFFRSIGISWLFSLIQTTSDKPSVLKSAINLISSQIAFIKNSIKNKQLTQNLLYLLKNLQQDPSLQNLLTILTLSENEKILTSYFKEITRFYAQQYRTSSPEYLIPLITEEPLIFQKVIQSIQKNSKIKHHLLDFSSQKMTLIEKVSQIIKCPSLDSKEITQLIIPTLDSLSPFLDFNDLEKKSEEFLKNSIFSNYNLKLLWKTFLEIPNIKILPNKIFQIFLFINYYNLSSIKLFSPKEKENLRNYLRYTDGLNPQITCSESFLENLNFSPENIKNFSSQSLFNEIFRSFFQEIFTNVDIIQCSETSINELSNLHKIICKNITLSDTQKERLLNQISNDEKLHKKLSNFLNLPLVKKILEKSYYEEKKLSSLPLEILLLFINNHASLIREILNTNEQEDVFFLEKTFLFYQTNIQSTNWFFYKKTILSIVEELITPISSSEDIFSKENLLDLILRNYFILENNSNLIKVFQKMLELTPNVTSLEEIVSFIDNNYRSSWLEFKKKIIKKFPKINQNCLVFLFLSQNQKSLLFSNEQAPLNQKAKTFYHKFLLNWKENLLSFNSNLLIQSIMEINNIIVSQETLLRKILNNTELGLIIQNNLTKIDPKILDNIYSHITSEEYSQAEADHVEAMSNIIPFGLVQYVGDSTAFSNEEQIKKHMISHGFSNQFPENQPVIVMRFTNHYVALIKKT